MACPHLRCPEAFVAKSIGLFQGWPLQLPVFQIGRTEYLKTLPRILIVCPEQVVGIFVIKDGRICLMYEILSTCTADHKKQREADGQANPGNKRTCVPVCLVKVSKGCRKAT